MNFLFHTRDLARQVYGERLLMKERRWGLGTQAQALAMQHAGVVGAVVSLTDLYGKTIVIIIVD